ncbi:MAG: 1-acyl-sn-glycerol-3-phosphate acyltransferase [Candidatus Omnitrophica bacterium]|nr:1-acyl-sn-glycerol-3-phosphate acyltransferase [Candidatus Omnitrophota bacterium]
MAFLKGITILLLIFFYILNALPLSFISIFSKKIYYRSISRWTKFITNNFNKILGIKINVIGNIDSLKEKNNFIISNHVSYVDGLVLASIFPLIFVSKLSVKFWPIFGQMAQWGGTVFVDRQNKRNAIHSLKKMTEILKNGTNLLFFPEGTSTDGTKIIEFQSIFFQVPFEINATIIPITIQYLKINDQELSLLNRDKVLWYGQKKIFWHFLSLLRLKKIKVKVIVHPKIKADRYIFKDRKELSRYCREIISKSFSALK